MTIDAEPRPSGGYVTIAVPAEMLEPVIRFIETGGLMHDGHPGPSRGQPYATPDEELVFSPPYGNMEATRTSLASLPENATRTATAYASAFPTADPAVWTVQEIAFLYANVSENARGVLSMMTTGFEERDYWISDVELLGATSFDPDSPAGLPDALGQLYGMMGALGRTIRRDMRKSTKPYAERRAPSGEGREYRLDPEAARVIRSLFEYDEHAGRGY